MSADPAALSAEHEALIQFLYLAPVGLVQADVHGEVAMMNPVAAQLLMPLSRDGGLDNLYVALESVAPDLRTLVQRHAEASGKVCDGLHVYLNAGAGGKRVPQILSVTLLKLDPERVMAVISDITEQVRRERRLRQNDAWLNAILAGVKDYALVSLDLEGRICDWNPSIGRVTGFGAEVIGRPYTILYPPDAMTLEHRHDRLREADANGWSLDEGRRLRADGSAFWGSTLLAPLPDREPLPGDADDGAAYCLILRDIGDQQGLAERRHDDAVRDHLTGLANRRALFEAAERELGRSTLAPRPTTLLVIDADHFKGINDRHGHPGGDAVLRHLAGILSETFREVDVVARIGGEEFAVLLPSTDLARALPVAERLRANVAAQPALIGGQPVPCTVSVGIAVVRDGGDGIDRLLARADQALYAAKRSGRNRIDHWRAELDTPTHRLEENADAA